MPCLKDVTVSPSPTAVGLRVPNVRRAAEFYQRIGFTYVMAVPDENGEWLLCLLRFGSGSILLGALDHPRFPRTRHQRRVQSESRGLDGTIELCVPDLGATYSACLRAGCSITLEPTQSWGDCSFRCVDPFGYEWRFTQSAGRSSQPPGSSVPLLARPPQRA